MKAKMLTRINALLALLLGALGFTACEPEHMVAEYGVPHADLTIEGEVTNEAKEALPDIQITAKGGWKDDAKIMYWSGERFTLATGTDGRFYGYYQGAFPLQIYKIYATDTTGVYAPDSIETTVTFSEGNGHWYKGKGTLHADFVLKRK